MHASILASGSWARAGCMLHAAVTQCCLWARGAHGFSTSLSSGCPGCPRPVVHRSISASSVHAFVMAGGPRVIISPLLWAMCCSALGCLGACHGAKMYTLQYSDIPLYNKWLQVTAIAGATERGPCRGTHCATTTKLPHTVCFGTPRACNQ